MKEDPKKILFDHGLPVLIQAGVKEAVARRVIGRWLKTHSPERVTKALKECRAQNAIDPIGYAQSLLRGDSVDPGGVERWLNG